MRIVVCGSAGTGKTTLINHIAPTLGYPIIPDFADIVLSERGYKSFKETSNEVSRQIRLEALERKIEAELKEEDFISDKCVVNYLAYWMILAMHDATEEENDKFFNLTKQHVQNYDIVIIPPFGRFNIEDNKIRTTNERYQYRNQVMIKGIYAELGISWVDYALDLKKSPEKVVEELGIK